MAHPMAGVALQQLVDEPPPHAATAGLRMHRDLPDEQGVGLFRRQIARNPAERPSGKFRKGAGVGEMRALQQVAIQRVVIERLNAADESPDRWTVCLLRAAIMDLSAALRA